ncbi:MAG: MBOAT family protein, partial [Clostridiales bacterium]
MGISYLFYAVAGIKTIGFIMITTLTTWLGALYLNKISDTRQIVFNSQKEQMTQAEQKAFKAATKQKRRVLFWLVIVFNFGILAVLKYSNFVLINISNLVASVTNEMATFTPLHLLLPLGISFYTFQSMGYLIDVYNNKYKADTNWAKFALFVSFFPQIIQGPIGRHDQLAGQFYTPKSFDWNRFEQAALLMLWGYFKKMVIADTAVILVNQVFDNAYSYSGTTIVVAVLFYSIQQYADFSGGIDIVTGAAQLFGIQLAPNFRRPYFSTSLGEFWRRWHI